MNHIYKVIWSRAKHCYVVASEIARSCTKSASGRKKAAIRTVTALTLVGLLAGAGAGVAQAATAGTFSGLDVKVFEDADGNNQQNAIKQGMVAAASTYLSTYYTQIQASKSATEAATAAYSAAWTTFTTTYKNVSGTEWSKETWPEGGKVSFKASSTDSSINGVYFTTADNEETEGTATGTVRAAAAKIGDLVISETQNRVTIQSNATTEGKPDAEILIGGNKNGNDKTAAQLYINKEGGGHFRGAAGNGLDLRSSTDNIPGSVSLYSAGNDSGKKSVLDLTTSAATLTSASGGAVTLNANGDARLESNATDDSGNTVGFKAFGSTGDYAGQTFIRGKKNTITGETVINGVTISTADTDGDSQGLSTISRVKAMDYVDEQGDYITDNDNYAATVGQIRKLAKNVEDTLEEDYVAWDTDDATGAPIKGQIGGVTLKDGDVTADKVTAKSASIGGTSIDANGIKAGDVYISNTGNVTAKNGTFTGSLSVGQNDSGNATFNVGTNGAIKAADGKFYVYSDGTIKAADGDFYVGEHGTITAAENNFKVASDGSITSKGNIIASGTLNVADGKFKVGADGGFTAANGSFKVGSNGNVTTSGTITSKGNVYVGEDNKIVLWANNGSMKAASGKFQVSSEGAVTATSGIIGAVSISAANDDGLSTISNVQAVDYKTVTTDGYSEEYKNYAATVGQLNEIYGELLQVEDSYVAWDEDDEDQNTIHGVKLAKGVVSGKAASGNTYTLDGNALQMKNSDGSVTSQYGATWMTVGNNILSVNDSLISAYDGKFKITPAGNIETAGTLSAANGKFKVTDSGSVTAAGLVSAGSLSVNGGKASITADGDAYAHSLTISGGAVISEGTNGVSTISNVADGKNTNDAVNYGQLYTVDQKVGTASFTGAKNIASTTTNLTQAVLDLDGKMGDVSKLTDGLGDDLTSAVNAAYSEAQKHTAVKVGGVEATTADTEVKGGNLVLTKSETDNGDVYDVKLDTTLTGLESVSTKKLDISDEATIAGVKLAKDATDGSYVMISNGGDTTTVKSVLTQKGLKVTDESSNAIASYEADGVHLGTTASLTTKGLTFDGTNYYVSADGLSGGSKVISNVGVAQLAENGTDAATTGQVYEVAQSVTTNKDAIDALKTKVGNGTLDSDNKYAKTDLITSVNALDDAVVKNEGNITANTNAINALESYTGKVENLNADLKEPEGTATTLTGSVNKAYKAAVAAKTKVVKATGEENLTLDSSVSEKDGSTTYTIGLSKELNLTSVTATTGNFTTLSSPDYSTATEGYQLTKDGLTVKGSAGKSELADATLTLTGTDNTTATLSNSALSFDNTTTLNKSGLTIGTEGDSQILLTTDKISMGGQQIHNVAAGEKETDAVNVKQMTDAINKIESQSPDGEKGGIVRYSKDDGSETDNALHASAGDSGKLDLNSDGSASLASSGDSKNGFYAYKGTTDGQTTDYNLILGRTTTSASKRNTDQGSVTIYNVVQNVSDDMISSSVTKKTGTTDGTTDTTTKTETSTLDLKGTSIESNVSDGSNKSSVTQEAGKISASVTDSEGTSSVDMTGSAVTVNADTNVNGGLSVTDTTAATDTTKESTSTLTFNDESGLNVSTQGNTITANSKGITATSNGGAKLTLDKDGNASIASKEGNGFTASQDGTNTIKGATTIEGVTISEEDSNGHSKISGVADGVDTYDAVNKGQLDTVATNLQNNINKEHDERVEADQNLQNNINTEHDARIEADRALQAEYTKLIAETGENLQTNINKEHDERVEADKNLQANINAESEARVAADTILQEHINENTNAIGDRQYTSTNYVKKGDSLTTAVSSLDKQVGTNTNAISDINTKLGTSTFTNGKTTYGDAINANTDAISTETSERQAGDAILGQHIQSVDRDARKGIAGVAALAALHPLDFDPDAKWDFAAGFGNYKGENAAAVGAFYRPNEDVMFSVGGSLGNGNNAVNAGVSVKLGAGSSHVTTSRTAVAKEVKSLRDTVETQAAQIAQLTALVNSLVGKNAVAQPDTMFPDVPENHWAYEAVAHMAASGLIEGYPDGEFKGDRMMTRYEFAQIVHRALAAGAPDSEEVQKLKAEFAPELEYYTVDAVHKDADGNAVVERVRATR